MFRMRRVGWRCGAACVQARVSGGVHHGPTSRRHQTTAHQPAASSAGDLLTEQQLLSNKLKPEYNAIIVGGGHNGLVAAAYLAKAGFDVCVLERRHLLGGAAVTEEIIPGFKFSRASYVLSLLRPKVFNDLSLKEHGLKVYLRDPNSYTPLLENYWKDGRARSLVMGRDHSMNQQQIAQFSQRDAKVYGDYEDMLGRMVAAIDPLLDAEPFRPAAWADPGIRSKLRNMHGAKRILQTAFSLGRDAGDFWELLTAPANKVLNKWFESEPLKATLATDSVIGAMISPDHAGSGYVLLHHVMGELEGIKGAWGYVEGGMGSVSLAIARSAHNHGAHLFTDKAVQEIDVGPSGAVNGVVLQDGTHIRSQIVLSNATPAVTFLDLVSRRCLPDKFVEDISHFDYTSPVTKINVAVSRLPNFVADPNGKDGLPCPHHRSTIHINCENTQLLMDAYQDAQRGEFSKKPVIEMTIPSSLDSTVAPPGAHVVQLFTQYTPYTLAGGKQWDEQTKQQYADTVFGDIERYAPGFKESILGYDLLTPPDLERVFGLTGGNIFHGAISLDQLYFTRPTASHCDHRTPVSGLYMCGSGTHPGGGVMGAPGRLAALAALRDWQG